MSEIERFTAKFKKLSNGCWEWQASKSGKGYGYFYCKETGVGRAHRFSYQHYVGPIPKDYVIDHLCRNTSCVNPEHLEAVTSGENVLRGIGVTALNAKKTHCKSGHPFVGENVSVRTLKRNGRMETMRVCRECRILLQKKKDAERKASRAHNLPRARNERGRFCKRVL